MSKKKTATAKRSATKKRAQDPVPCPECLPCPFCGSTPTIEPWHGGGPQKRMIMCDNDGCHHGAAVTGPTRRAAIALWNRRAPLPGACAATHTATVIDSVRDYAERLSTSMIAAQAGVGTRLLQMIDESKGGA